MKKLLTIILVILGMTVFAQTKPNAVLDSNGNYRPLSEVYKFTGKYYIDKDDLKHPIYLNAAGKLFIIVKAKSAKVYKRTLKI